MSVFHSQTKVKKEFQIGQVFNFASFRIGGAPGTPIGGPPSKPGTGNLVIGRNDVPGPSPLSVAPSPLSNSGAMLQGSSIQPVQPVQTQSPQSSNAEKSSVHGQVDPNAPKSLSSQVTGSNRQ